MDLAALRVEVATLNCEVAHVEFKSSAGFVEPRFWIQLIRSVIAMHNSGGGVIIFGLDSGGCDLNEDLADVRKIDPVQVSQKCAKYTDRPLAGVEKCEFQRGETSFPGWIIPGAEVPLPFARPGEVHNGKGKPELLFSAGQLYVRRGAASVPADASDLYVVAERIRNAARREFAAQIGQFAVIPSGHSIQVMPLANQNGEGVTAQAVRVTNDPGAQCVMVVDKFASHPHRQKELIRRLLIRLPSVQLNGHDILCIKKVYPDVIRENEFTYSPNHCSTFYSEGFAEWIAERISQDAQFLEGTRARWRKEIQGIGS